MYFLFPNLLDFKSSDDAGSGTFGDAFIAEVESGSFTETPSAISDGEANKMNQNDDEAPSASASERGIMCISNNNINTAAADPPFPKRARPYTKVVLKRSVVISHENIRPDDSRIQIITSGPKELGNGTMSGSLAYSRELEMSKILGHELDVSGVLRAESIKLKALQSNDNQTVIVAPPSTSSSFSGAGAGAGAGGGSLLQQLFLRPREAVSVSNNNNTSMITETSEQQSSSSATAPPPHPPPPSISISTSSSLPLPIIPTLYDSFFVYDASYCKKGASHAVSNKRGHITLVQSSQPWGSDLWNWVTQHPERFADESLRRCIIRQIFVLLASLHAKGIIHRDLKLANVLLDFNEAGYPLVKLCDMGSVRYSPMYNRTKSKNSKEVSSSSAIVPSAATGATAGATTVDQFSSTSSPPVSPFGTPYVCSRYYRAPELLCGSCVYDEAVDVWAMATSLVEMYMQLASLTDENAADELSYSRGDGGNDVDFEDPTTYSRRRCVLFPGMATDGHQVAHIFNLLGVPTDEDIEGMRLPTWGASFLRRTGRYINTCASIESTGDYKLLRRYVRHVADANVRIRSRRDIPSALGSAFELNSSSSLGGGGGGGGAAKTTATASSSSYVCNLRVDALEAEVMKPISGKTTSNKEEKSDGETGVVQENGSSSSSAAAASRSRSSTPPPPLSEALNNALQSRHHVGPLNLVEFLSARYVPSDMASLFASMLTWDPNRRMSAQEALNHPALLLPPYTPSELRQASSNGGGKLKVVQEAKQEEDEEEVEEEEEDDDDCGLSLPSPVMQEDEDEGDDDEYGGGGGGKSRTDLDSDTTTEMSLPISTNITTTTTTTAAATATGGGNGACSGDTEPETMQSHYFIPSFSSYSTQKNQREENSGTSAGKYEEKDDINATTAMDVVPAHEATTTTTTTTTTTMNTFIPPSSTRNSTTSTSSNLRSSNITKTKDSSMETMMMISSSILDTTLLGHSIVADI